MAFRHIIILLFLMTLLSRCSIPSKQVVGKYVDKAFRDTLKIYNDKSYDYIEKLNSGILGLTQGKWEIKNRKIQFECDHKPLVGYRIKVRRDSSSNNFQLKLELGDTKEPIYMEGVQIFKNGFRLSKSNLEKSKNVVKIFTSDYDSIVIQTFNFTNLTFTNSLNPNYGHIAKIYPIERLYELDKVPFGIHRRTLKSVKTKEYGNIFFSFKKIEK